MTKEERCVAREARERKRLEKAKAKGRYKGYFWVLFAIIVMVNMLDEVSSSIGGTVTTNIIEDLFVRNPFLGKFYTLEEGIALRQGGITLPILVLGWTDPALAPMLAEYALAQSVFEEAYAAELSAAGLPLDIHVKLDTGMSRTGIFAQEHPVFIG